MSDIPRNEVGPTQDVPGLITLFRSRILQRYLRSTMDPL